MEKAPKKYPSLKEVAPVTLNVTNPLPVAGTYWQTAWVVCSHMLVSCLSLLNSHNSGALYPATLLPSYLGNLIQDTRYIS